MSKGQEESDDRVVPEDRRKAIPTASKKRGGKAITASEVTGQLDLFRETADSPQGHAEGGAGQPALGLRAGPKSRTNTNTIPYAMTMEEIADETNLRKALKRVASNKGAPGPDRRTIDQVREHFDDLVPSLRRSLIDGDYRPGMIRRVWIAKAGGGQRGLGIPNVIDRIVQQAAYQVLSPHFEPAFHGSSHGFRPERSCHTAIAEAKQHLEKGRCRWVVDLDLEKFFDRVHHQRLLARLADKGVKDPRVLRLIQRMLKAKVVMPDGVVVSTEEGAPQGGPLSPLLSNIVLDELDCELDRRGHRFVRYADDCNIYVRSERAGERVMASVTRFIERRLRLKVNQEKSAVARPGARHFVGFALARPRPGPILVRLSRRSAARVRRKIVELTPRNWGRSIRTCIDRINTFLRGWVAFFKICGAGEVRIAFNELDAHIRRRLRALILRQKKRERHIVHWLISRGVKPSVAKRSIYRGRRSLWVLSHTPAVDKAMNVRFFERLGLLSAQKYWQELQAEHVIAPAQHDWTWNS